MASTRTMNILDRTREKILLLDGAMGTAIQALKLDESAYDGAFGCPEILGLTIPDKIREIHRGYLLAGADIVETNTFGSHPLVLAEYDLQGRTDELTRAAVRLAREAAEDVGTPDRPRFVAGSTGPGTKLATLGQTTWDALYESYARQFHAMLDEGVDMLLIETCQDLLQTKAALAAAFDQMKLTRRVPVYVSVTIEQTGTLLTGTDMSAVVAILAPFDIDILGMNCATGPVPMRPHLETLCKTWPKLTGVYPNAGIPVPGAGGVRYPEGPEEFAAALGRFVREMPINIVGGCCGTTPAHIERLAKEIDGLAPLAHTAKAPVAIASLFSPVTIRQDPPPLFFGERANATGSKAFREAILANNFEQAFDILAEQEEHGSHAADLSVAYAGKDELRDIDILTARASRECRLPLMIDSNIARAVEIALKRYAGRAVVNSINFEDGGERAKIVAPLARRFGAALVCLTIDEDGMAMTAERKVAIARRLVSTCVGEYGFQERDLFIDPLTFTIGSGDPSLVNAGVETLNAIRAIKREFPDVHLLLGLSNISFGLSLKSRRVLNSVFLDLALKAGLDAAILNPKHIVSLAEIDETDRGIALDLINNQRRGEADPLELFIHHFAGRKDDARDDIAADLPPHDALREGIVKGKTRALAENIDALLVERPAETILNDVLVPAMKHVGDLFGAGVLQLPFVLKSAEAMKRAVDHLKPHFETAEATAAKKKLLIATVRGDVHDIGKNLVNIIVTNNGFDVVDLGTKVPINAIMQAAKDVNADVIGMSGLLVSSAMLMEENLRAMSEAGIDKPVLVGGAALTPDFVRETLKPAYTTNGVTYCRDAFSGLVAMQHIAEGKTPPEDTAPASIAPDPGKRPGRPITVKRVAPPAAPFLGARVVTDVPLESIFPLVNEIALFRGRWGYRRGKMSAEEYARVDREEVRPRYEALQRLVKAERIFEPQFVYGYFPARRDGDAVIVPSNGDALRFEFPRRAVVPEICIADFVREDADVVGFFVVSLGGGVAEREHKEFASAEFLDYFLLHGLAVEMTDALAEYAHEQMRQEWGVGEEKRLSPQQLITQQYHGGRYAFGYPACPNLADNEKIFRLLDPARIGVSLAEGHQMVPEFSTSAIVLHHPQAKYFAA
ncbi:homocysteine S-methyltransferase family protein [bacterium]|nr:homocysteine S-methyltransferase family protein [bacterium]